MSRIRASVVVLGLLVVPMSGARGQRISVLLGAADARISGLSSQVANWGPFVGVAAPVWSSRTVRLEAGISYTAKGTRQRSDPVEIGVGGERMPLGPSTFSRDRLGYLEVPVTVRWSPLVSGPLVPYLIGGPVIGLLVDRSGCCHRSLDAGARVGVGVDGGVLGLRVFAERSFTGTYPSIWRTSAFNEAIGVALVWRPRASTAVR